MKKGNAILIAVLLCCMTAGCCLSHEWQEATCEEPKTCARCSENQGAALGHSWTEATCEEPKTCVRCSENQGAALGHSWTEATCTEEAVCGVCGVTGESALGHDIQHLSFDQTSYSGDCRRCNLTLEESVEDWEAFAPKLAVGRRRAITLLDSSGLYLGEGLTTEVLSEEEYLELREDHTAVMFLRDVTYTGSWSFRDYTIAPGVSESVQFVLDFGEEGKSQSYILSTSPNTMSVGLSSTKIAVFSEDENMIVNAERIRENQKTEEKQGS